MKTVTTAVMLSSMIAICATAHAAPIQITDQIMANQARADQAVFSRAPVGAPLNLLSPAVSGVRPTAESTVARVSCDAAESAAICDLRMAAARRAWEVVDEERATATADATPAFYADAPMSLLVPVGLIPVRAIACDPALSTEECARLEKRIPSNPSGPLPPTAPAPPATPIPPAVPAPDEPGVSKAPGPAVEPVPANPPSVLPPPPTGDHDLVQPPPKSESKMPVIKPKAAPPVIQ